MIQEEVKITAFMDDTTLISYNQESMQTLTDTCNEFYNINDININPNKSNLIIINNSGDPEIQQIEIGKDTITPLKPDIPVRILGVWHNGRGNKQYQKELIIQKIETFRKIIGGKRITNKQIIYLVNQVLMPSITYLLNNMIISQKEWNKIASKLSNTIKHKLGLAKTAPNNIIYNNKEYGMFHIWDRLMLLHGKNWTI